ncbi:Asp-tRNA(Asn)/Glu-tRNA(Gln) amidotransferase subunit GatA [Ruminococcus bicirculans (ex Wegman et al. 2014)]|uniref:Asp-tRNA(Asn)/Glu-tRNA(Gln) amidotransferase subunit GatA n=1 Tax=Ruminococcus bicirculans (ex Wegman et al. 2014) TaxID=1160721 RepID=UPI00095C42F4|nr:Asp-tRNA(Asn)/Glu-tRNA(Gln) amidotransferase subunit GatA [Ruminococcus bicirculans (ex Wegman et al. 2014)]OLA45815.1 MAG: aspartyl/glutamyl-tRNA amidotransferase subunit A [Ruminococcus bicirculans (ex Wegman et al. 2014)]
MELFERNACDLSEMIKNKEISSAELTKSVFDRIKTVEDKVDAYLTLDEENAMKKAAEIDEKLAKGEELSPLAGIPVGIKDNISTKGLRTTCASKMLGNYVPPFNATVMNKLDDIVITGKLNMDEFAMGSSTENSHFKPTKNPFDTERIPGGSSGGSAAAVAAGLAPVALGTDTGGSIRQPAAFCGVTGIKPTYSRVSRFGLVAFASSLDQIGSIGLDAHDCAILLNEICGYDFHDGTSSKLEVPDFTAKIGESMKGMKIALPKEFYAEGINDEVKAAVLKAAEEYKAMGAELIECSMPSLKYAVPCYYLLACAEAASNLSRYDGIKYGHRTATADSYEELIIKSRSEGFGEEVKRRILLGNYCLSSGYYDAYYRKAMALRQLIRKEYNDIFEKCDVILTPTTPAVAYSPEMTSDPVQMYQADICTVTVNIAGLPAISTPCGYDSKGMPIGMSVIGRKFDEATIIKTADAYEKGFKPVAPKL